MKSVVDKFGDFQEAFKEAFKVSSHGALGDTMSVVDKFGDFQEAFKEAFQLLSHGALGDTMAIKVKLTIIDR